MTTRCNLQSCACVIDFEAIDPTDPRKVVRSRFEIQCITHNTPNEALTHEQSFNTRFGNNPSESEIITMHDSRKTESQQPQFQSR